MTVDVEEGAAQFPRARTPDRIEWPTIVVLASFYAAFVGVVVGHAALPWPVAIVVFAFLGGLHMSLVHEVLHGHPTPSQWLNELLVAVPAVMWIPYAEYRNSHRRHHRAELTVPGLDPESFYVDAASWARANPLWRGLLRANRTLLGRMLIWPAVTIVRTVLGAIREIPSDARVRRAWASHAVAAALSVWLVCGVGGVPWWSFLGGFTYGGLSLTYLRSFVEHLDVESGTECAVVQSNAFFGLLFLNNNLHHTHHARPDAAWFRLPALRRELRSDEVAAAGAGWYRGYVDVMRRHLLRPFDAPVRPSDR
jgi:fatty acid desaturase